MTAEPDILDVEAQHRLGTDLGRIQIPNIAEAVMRASGRVGGRGIIDRYLKAARGPGKLSIHEFIYYRLYEPDLPADELGRFVSAKMRHKHTLACNSRDWAAPTFDKIHWDLILAGAGLPRPELRAVFGAGSPAPGSAWLRTGEELERFLRDPANYPMFGKPNGGGRSLGVLRLDGLEGDQIRLQRGETRPIAAVVKFIENISKAGYLFQTILQPHPEIARITGGVVATARVFLLLRPDDVWIENITLKVPRASAFVDNYWRSGNMIAAVDTNTGAITRAVTGSGLDLAEVQTHPDTGAQLVGATIPDLPALRAFCAAAAPHLSGLKIQGWDIAFTDRGPVPVELNFGGDVNLQQLAHNAGALTPTYGTHLRACGYKGPLPG